MGDTSKSSILAGLFNLNHPALGVAIILGPKNALQGQGLPAQVGTRRLIHAMFRSSCLLVRKMPEGPGIFDRSQDLEKNQSKTLLLGPFPKKNCFRCTTSRVWRFSMFFLWSPGPRSSSGLRSTPTNPASYSTSPNGPNMSQTDVPSGID